MAINVSSALIAALPISHKFVSKLEVWTDGIGSGAAGPTLLQEIDSFTAMTVSEDETRQVRRTLSVTIHSAPLGDPNSIVPVAPGDLLHPVSGNELRPFCGIEYPDGSIEWCPKGVFRISKPQVVDLGGEVSIQLTGNDRSITITQAGWQDAWSPVPGTSIDSVIKAGITHVFPNSNYAFNLKPSSIPISGGVIFGAQLDSTNDPWKDMQDLATAIGNELFFDALGVLTMRLVPSADGAASTWPTIPPNNKYPQQLYYEGPECIIPASGSQGFTHTIDETGAFSRVIAVGNNPNGPSVQGIANDTNPLSSTYYLGPFGIVTKVISSPAVTTVGQAQQMAQSYLNQFGLALDEISFPAITNPALEAGDILMAQDDRLGVANVYAVSAVTTPFDAASLQTIVCRPSRGGPRFPH